jgi:hypothetical protein
MVSASSGTAQAPDDHGVGNSDIAVVIYLVSSCAPVARLRSYPSSGSRGFVLAAQTIAATHSSGSAYSLASVVSRT